MISWNKKENIMKTLVLTAAVASMFVGCTSKTLAPVVGSTSSTAAVVESTLPTVSGTAVVGWVSGTAIVDWVSETTTSVSSVSNSAADASVVPATADKK